MAWIILDHFDTGKVEANAKRGGCFSTAGCIHVELVTNLDMSNFLMAFSKLTNLHDSVDTFFPDNGSTFYAASNQLSELLGSTEFHNVLRKRNINWVRIPP